MMIRTAAFRLFWGILTILFLLPASSVVPHGQDGNSRPPGIVTPSSPRLDADFGKIPLQFIPNRGQMDGRVAYYVQGRDKTIYFTAEGLTFVLVRWAAENGKENSGALQASEPRTESRWVVKLDFVDSDKNVKPVGLEKSGAAVSYFKGKPEEWNTGIAACSKIAYRDLWPGIDLVYSGTINRMKYEFVVHPGADPSRIKLAYRGAERVALTVEGRLEVLTPAGGFEDDTPVAYQEVDGERVDVPVAFDLVSEAYGFDIGDYDRSRTLILDPSAFIYCGFIGGAGDEEGRAIALDAAGSAYIVGATSSDESTFPVTVGPDLTYDDANGAGFVAKVSPDGTALVYCGYIAGATCRGIAVDDSGSAYIIGSASSPDDGFPVALGPDLSFNGGGDAFVAKIAASGTGLVYCGYVGGSSSDLGYGIAVDGPGNAYITGITYSNESTFPVMVGPDVTFNNILDAFVAKVNSAGTALEYCGYIGSSGHDYGYGIAVDSVGYAYVTGSTYRHEDEQGVPIPPLFPEIVGPDLTFNGYMDAFVAKVDLTGVSLVYCGYIGGLTQDYGSAIAVDGSGNAYVAGTTDSSEAGFFPVKVGPDLMYNGRDDAFVAKVAASGATLVYCGYVGGSEDDRAYAIAVDSAGNAYITGETWSDELTFPTVDGPDRNRNSMIDAFVAKVDSSGAGLAYCGYIGGGDNDYGYGIAVDASGYAYIAGTTDSSEADFFPVTVGPDLTSNSLNNEAFVAKVPAVPYFSIPEINSITPSAAAPREQGFTMVVSGSNFGERAIVNWSGERRPTTFISETELRAEISQSDLGHGQIVPVTVRNPEGETSNAVDFSVNNPVPVLDSVEPAYLTGGGPETAIFLKGSNFVENSVVRWNGQDIMTGLSIDEGWAIVPESGLAQGGEGAVTIFNPAPAGGTSSALTIPVTSFILSASPQSATVAAGQAATYTIQVTPRLGSFDARVEFSCGNLPRGCTKSFYPVGAIPGAAGTSTVLTLTTTADSGAAAASLSAPSPFGSLPPGMLLLLPAIFLLLRIRKPALVRPTRRRLWASAAACLLILAVSCGVEKPPGTGTPAGTHNITVEGKSGTMTVLLTVRLVVQ